jgi:hypothetical protein
MSIWWRALLAILSFPAAELLDTDAAGCGMDPNG